MIEMVKYSHREMRKKLIGRKVFWEVYNITKSDNIHSYFFDSYTDAKDYFDRCIVRKSKRVILTEIYEISHGQYTTKENDVFPKWK